MLEIEFVNNNYDLNILKGYKKNQGKWCIKDD